MDRSCLCWRKNSEPKKVGARGRTLSEFMSGGRPKPNRVGSKGRTRHGKMHRNCLSGRGSGAKIREVLGPTDPSKAPPGSIRKEFGQTIMINAAHASDSIENAQREMKIVQVDENNFKPLIDELLPPEITKL